jgi:indole-3-glycerol phosphate synthase
LILDKIIANTRKRIATEKESVPSTQLTAEIEKSNRKPHDFSSAFREPGVHVIAEIKRASPSAGKINLDSDPLTIAGNYLENGARALSVLTEPDFFRGSIDYLAQIRSKYPDARLLMKDFIVDGYQLLQGRRAGADAVLLIARVLEKDQLGAMLSSAQALGLTSLVEVHNEHELSVALDQGATLVGVNNRDLDTLTIDLGVSRRLAKLPRSKETVLIAESGLENGEQLKELGQLGYRGFLIGTTFMKDGEPGKKLAELLREAQ